MSLELTAIPLGLLAGVLGVLSPCVWPLVPVVTSSASMSGRSGPLWLALGLSLSFAAAGTLLTWLLVSTGLDPELFRYLAALILMTVGAVLLVQRWGEGLTLLLSGLSARFNLGGGGRGREGSARSQFGVGALLGVVWLPCVGPTMGAAIALASIGQKMSLAFAVMLAYGVGTAGVLLGAGVLSSRLLARWRPRLLAGGQFGKKLLGGSLLILGVLVITGIDKWLEAWGVNLLPEWIFTL